MKKSLISLAVLGALSLPSFTYAAEAAKEEATPDYTITSSASFVSDYIFRGQSQTWGKPAAQISTELAHKSGLYAGFFASNVSDKWLPGASLETDLYAGYRNTIGATDVGFDVGGIYYMYPGANWEDAYLTPTAPRNKLDTFEVYGGLSYKWMSFKTGVTTTDYWGWTDENSAPPTGFNGDSSAGVKRGNTRGSYFAELNAAYEVAPTWTVSGQLGRQVIAHSAGLDLTYYKVGISKALPKEWSIAAFYSGTNEPDAYKDFLSLSNSGNKSDIAKDKVFFSISKSF